MNRITHTLLLWCVTLGLWPAGAQDLDRAAISAKFAELSALFAPVVDPPAPVRKLVAWTPADYAPQSGYSGFAVGLTRGGFLLTESGSALQIAVTGRQRPAGIGSPGQVAETAGSPYELLLNVEILTADRSVRLAGPFQVLWSGKRLLYAAPGADYPSDIIPVDFTEGSLLEYQSLAWRIASVGQTIAGEPGQMAATVPDWPRSEGIGGALNTFGLYGTRFTSNPSTSLAAWVAALDAGTFIPPADASSSLNQGGFAPIAVTGLVSAEAPPALLDIQDSIARSGDAANRTRPDSGTGYLRAATQGQVGGFQWSLSGQKLADVIVPGNITHRAQYLPYANAAFIGLISNDLKDDTVAVSETRFRALVAYLRANGYEKISAGNCLARWVTADNWRTYAGQSEQLPGFNAKALAWDDRLAAMLAEGVIDRVVDRRTAVQDPANEWKWRLPVVVASFNAADNSTLGTIKAGSQGWTTDIFTSRHVSVAGAASLVLFGNSSTQLNVSAGASASTPVATGTPIEVLDVTGPDGVHPGPYGNHLISQALAPFIP